MDHLFQTPTGSPEYACNIARVLDSTCTETQLRANLRGPLVKLTDVLDAQQSESPEKLKDVRGSLAEAWAQRVFGIVGECLSEMLIFDGNKLQISKDLGGVRFEVSMSSTSAHGQDDTPHGNNGERHPIASSSKVNAKPRGSEPNTTRSLSSSCSTIGSGDSGFDRKTDLTIAHLLLDSNAHPLYDCHVDEVVDLTGIESNIDDYVKAPLMSLLDRLDAHQHLAPDSLRRAEATVVDSWSERVGLRLSEVLAATGHFQKESRRRLICWRQSGPSLEATADAETSVQDIPPGEDSVSDSPYGDARSSHSAGGEGAFERDQSPEVHSNKKRQAPAKDGTASKRVLRRRKHEPLIARAIVRRGRPAGTGTFEFRRPTADNEWWSVSASHYGQAARKEKYRYSNVGQAQEMGAPRVPACARKATNPTTSDMASVAFAGSAERQSGVRKRSSSSEVAERRGRQKLEHHGGTRSHESTHHDKDALDPATDLALDHLLFDREAHPLYQRNVDQVLDSFCSEAALQPYLHMPLATFMRHMGERESDTMQKWGAVRQRLLAGWAERVLKTIGDSLCDVMDMAGDGTHVFMELDKARVELKVIPVVEVADSESGESGMEDEWGQMEEVDGRDSAVDCTQDRDERATGSISEEGEDDDLAVPSADWEIGTTQGSRDYLGYNLTAALEQLSGHTTDTGLFEDDDRYLGFGARAAMAIVGLHRYEQYGQPIADPQNAMLRHFPRARQLYQHHFISRLLPFSMHSALQYANIEAREEWDGLDNAAQQPWILRHELLLAGDQAMLYLETSLSVPHEAIHPVAAEAQVQSLCGLRIFYHKVVDAPETVLMLQVPHLRKCTSPKGEPRWPRLEEIRECVCGSLLNRDRVADFDIKAFTHRNWVVEFHSADGAQRAAGTVVYIRDTSSVLWPFTPRRSQVFVCKNVPQNLNLDRALIDLLRALPDRRFHLRRSPTYSPRKITYLVLMLEVPADIEKFQLALLTHDNDKDRWVAVFNCWQGGGNCAICGGNHSLHQCHVCGPVQPTGDRDPRLMIAPPVIATIAH
ncbi:hypothetical protein LTR36_007842 [Oleoguttula mirabilis]|uniref:Uncharacterized protein n=1 Tax=Oleoguttula mirabilis TaxID=1507867 RepID=A0AAV9J9I7_9PEZI|nr:hypothetical protein LTR36_007842 [Oleoguttula mirabilis]